VTSALNVPRRPLAIACLVAVAGCAMPVENPSVYEAQRFLCAEEHAGALQDAIEDCRDDFERDESCAGVLSFTGQLEGEPITVESRLASSEVLDLRSDGEGSEIREELKLSGSSPYFHFTISWLDIGGDLTGGADDRTLQYGAARDRGEALQDDRVSVSLRMTVGGESRAFTPRQGELITELQRLDEHAAAFSADFAADDHLDGCFHAFANEHKFTTEASSDAR
jgi:hypothetical protein